jgi:RNA-directed DNA polymerase
LKANPFTPDWATYFEERVGFKMQNPLRDKKRLIHLWLEQERRCPVCNQLITLNSGWHLHRIIRRVDGGGNGSNNLIMRHPNYHNQIHAAGLKVVKSVRENGL